MVRGRCIISTPGGDRNVRTKVYVHVFVLVEKPPKPPKLMIKSKPVNDSNELLGKRCAFELCFVALLAARHSVRARVEDGAGTHLLALFTQ